MLLMVSLGIAASAGVLALSRRAPDLSTRLSRRTAQIKARTREQVQATALVNYPHSLKTGLVKIDGTTRPAMIRVYPDGVYIYERDPDKLVANLKLPDILAVGQKNLSRKGREMAGFALVTPNGQYRFLSQGSLAVWKVEETVRAITTTVEFETKKALPMLGDGYLH